MYGDLKSKRNQYTNEQLSQKLADGEFTLFKELRTKLTAWVKTGLGVSRQLEQFYTPTQNPDTIPPLLTIRSLAVGLNNEYEQYLNEIDYLRRNLLIWVITEANTKLTLLNTETRTMLDQLGDTEAAVVIAKAFKAATQAGSYLFKQKNIQPTTQETGSRADHGPLPHTMPSQPQMTQTNHEIQQQRLVTRSLYSQVVGTNTNTSATARNYTTYRGTTANWRQGRDSSNSPFNRRSDRFEPKPQREMSTKTYHNYTRTENRPPYQPPGSSQEMLPPRPGPTQDQPKSLLQLAPIKQITHPRFLANLICQARRTDP